MFRFQYLLIICAILKETTLICTENKKMLPIPQSDQSMETSVRSVQAILPNREKLWFLGKDVSTYFESSFSGDSQNREKKFGSFLRIKKIPIATNTDQTTWVDIGLQDHLFLLLDGQSLLMVAHGEDGKEIARRSIVWDLVQPSHDAVGEPTTWEIKQLRAEVKTKMEKLPGKKLTGMVALPDSWSKDKKRTWLVSTDLPNLPIFLMECADLEPTQCQLARACPLSFGADKIEVGGVGIDEKHHRIFLVDRTNNALRIIRYGSCSDLSQVTTWMFPEVINNVTNVKMDASANLWVTLAEPDPYTNGSLFYYTQKELAPLL